MSESMRPPSISSLLASIAFVLGVAGCRGDKSQDVAQGADAPRLTNAQVGGSSGASGAATGSASWTVSAPSPSASAMPSLAGALGNGPATAAAKTHAHAPPIGAGTLVDVPAGTFPSGSTPGDEGREPALEPALVDIALPAFQIDALPYPNDPRQPVRTGVSQAEAAQLCGARGERLCSELEWERACKGDANDMFSTGAGWDATCDSDRASCASGFGARGMGVMPEHTSSTFAAAEHAVRAGADSAIVRGGDSSAAGTDIVAAKRCAFRGRMNASTARNVGFRCCKGPESTQTIAPIQTHPPFRKSGIDAAALSKIVAQLPELSRFTDGVRFYDPADVANVTGRSGALHDGIAYSMTPILWSPETGTELLVATGRTKSTSFVLALYPLPHDKYRVASTFVMLNDVAPVALAYEPTNRKQLLWSSCWGCAGEQGAITVREDHKAIIVQY
jgi:hypothetical protein